MSPVSRLAFSVPGRRARITPRTLNTNSLRRLLAVATRSGACFLSTTICTIPVLSRRSMKTRSPKSRWRCTHPFSTTSLSISEDRVVPQSSVRFQLFTRISFLAFSSTGNDTAYSVPMGTVLPVVVEMTGSGGPKLHQESRKYQCRAGRQEERKTGKGRKEENPLLHFSVSLCIFSCLPFFLPSCSAFPALPLHFLSSLRRKRAVL